MEANDTPDLVLTPYGNVAVLDRPDLRLLRLAELVMHLTDSTPELAWLAVNEAVASHGYPDSNEESLARVARAINSIRCGLDLR